MGDSYFLFEGVVGLAFVQIGLGLLHFFQGLFVVFILVFQGTSWSATWARVGAAMRLRVSS